LIGGYSDGTLRALDLDRSETSALRKSISAVTGTLITPQVNGRRRLICSSSSSGTLRAWDLISGEALSFKGEVSHRLVSGMCFVDNGEGTSLLAAGGGDDWSRRHYVSLFDIGSGKRVGKRLPHSDWIEEVSFGQLADGRPVLLSSDRSCSLNIWDLNERSRIGRRYIAEHWPHGLFSYLDHSNRAVCLAYTNGAQTGVHYVDLSTGSQIRRPFMMERGWMDCADLYVAADRVPILVKGDASGCLGLWNASRQVDVRKSIEAHDGAILAVRLCKLRDGRLIAVTAGRDFSLRIWDIKKMAPLGHRLNVPSKVNALDIVEEGRELLIAAGGEKGVLVTAIQVSKL
jgi:WD40 repeat protein